MLMRKFTDEERKQRKKESQHRYRVKNLDKIKIIRISKICSRCMEEKSIFEFCKDSIRKDGRYPYCRKCVSIERKEYRTKDGFKEKYNETRRRLRKKRPGVHWKEYGIKMTVEEYNTKFSEQNGCCAICGIHQSKLKMRLGVDHNHNNGQNRGLVCIPCNTLIGIFENKNHIITKINEYLKFWGNKEIKNGLSQFS